MRLVVQTSGTVGNVTSHLIAMKSVGYIIVDSIEGSNPSLTATLQSPDVSIRAFCYPRFCERCGQADGDGRRARV